MKHLLSLLMVGAGGSLGALLRYGITVLLKPVLAAFPLSTLLINMAGCLATGTVAGMVDASITIPPAARLFLITGFCGAFTTMSSFVYETDQLLKTGESLQAAIYFGGTLLGSFALFFAGYFAMKMILR